MALTEDQKAAREAWYLELEANRLPQAQGTMVGPDGNSYCCLAVAEYVQGYRSELCDCEQCTDGPRRYRIHGATSVMTRETAEAMGFTDGNPKLHVPVRLGYRETYVEAGMGMTSLNDSLELSFPEIAAVCRAQGDDWDGSGRYSYTAKPIDVGNPE